MNHLKKSSVLKLKKKNLYLLGKRPIESVKTQSHMKQRTWDIIHPGEIKKLHASNPWHLDYHPALVHFCASLAGLLVPLTLESSTWSLCLLDIPMNWNCPAEKSCGWDSNCLCHDSPNPKSLCEHPSSVTTTAGGAHQVQKLLHGGGLGDSQNHHMEAGNQGSPGKSQKTANLRQFLRIIKNFYKYPNFCILGRFVYTFRISEHWIIIG